jgi:myo-inositol-1(or 4)-monophosphatase
VKLLNDITGIIREAGAMILRASDAQVHEKEGHFNYVTDADMAVQAYLQNMLTGLLPGSVFFAEEKENAALTDQPTWVVDPIDGTLNFIRGRRCSCVSAALLIDRQPVSGAVYNPFADEMFTAEHGNGATLNGIKICVSETSLNKALITFGTSPYNADLAGETMRIAAAFLSVAGDLRRTGSAAIDLADIACGRADVFYELRLSPWDFAAGALLVKEAGGNVYMPRVGEVRYGISAGILACNKVCAQAALKIVAGSSVPSGANP